MNAFRTVLPALVIAGLVIVGLSATALAGDAPATPKTFKMEIRFQIKLIKKGDVSKLRTRFTKRQRQKINSAMLKKAGKELAKYSVDDLVHKVEPGTYKRQKLAKIKMKSGRTLTTFLLVDGQWQADTLWFK